jgi:ABC-2 type transport system permease protein
MSAAGPAPQWRQKAALSLRAYPTLLRIGLAEAVAYRAEMLVWMLTLTMPLVNMALWSSAASGTRLGPERMGSGELVAYFLLTLLLRLLVGSWVLWQISEDIRSGTLAQRLLRPVPPLVGYTAEQLAPVPLRAALVVPLSLLLLFTRARDQLTADPWLVLAFVLSLPGAWAINFFTMALLGSLAFYIDSATGLFYAWMGLYTLFSGYLMPLSLFPPWLRHLSDVLPFRYMLDAPVKMLLGWPVTGGTRDTEAGRWLAYQSLGIEYAYVVVLIGALLLVWRHGLRRFAAFGA